MRSKMFFLMLCLIYGEGVKLYIYLIKSINRAGIIDRDSSCQVNANN